MVLSWYYSSYRDGALTTLPDRVTRGDGETGGDSAAAEVSVIPVEVSAAPVEAVVDGAGSAGGLEEACCDTGIENWGCSSDSDS